MNLAEITEFDFDHELKFSSFPFNDVVKNSKHFSALLKAEYLQAPLRPKIYLYLREFISDEEWEASVMESYSRSRVSGSLPVAAPLVMPTETEIRSRRLAEEFYQKVADKSLDEKYYGRNISETPLVGLLKRLEEHLEVFRHYAIDHSDLNQYQSYGQAAAKSLIGIVNKLTDIQLRAMVFQQIMDMDITKEIAVQMIVNKLSETEQKAIKKRFIILKTFADEIFEQARKLFDEAPPAEIISDDNEEPVTLVSKGHGYYDYPDRFFSFDINNFKFTGNPEDDIQTQFRYRQIVLETKFLHAFKAADDKNLRFFLDEQYLLTPASKADFLDYVEIIGNANLKSTFQGASIKKVDVFRVWMEEKRKAQPANNSKKVLKSTATSLFLEPSQAQNYLNVLKVVDPPILTAAGDYRLGSHSKSAVVAWFDILDREGKIDTSLTAETRTQLLNEMIPKLSIDKRSLSNTHKRAYVAYHDKLERLIKRL